MNRKEACKIVDRWGRMSYDLRELLIDAVANGDEAHYDSLKTQFSYETETAVADVLRTFLTGLKRGSAPARQITEKPENVVNIRQTISQPVRPWRGDDPGAA